MDWENANDFATRICGAADDYDEPAAARAVDDLISHLICTAPSFPLTAARRALGCLRNKRYFAHLQRLADAFIQNGQEAPEVYRNYAQALIENKAFLAAIAVLTGLAQRTLEADDAAENAEANGLLGRVYKQLYVDGGRGLTQRESYVETAIGYYRPVFASDPARHYWHGINAVALMLRGAADGFAGCHRAEAIDMAREILRILEKQQASGSADCWALATAMEACIAIEDFEAALGWARLYVDSPDADAFELGSTLRQLTEVWRLGPGPGPDGAMLEMLESQLLTRSGGKLGYDAPQEARERLETGENGRRYEAILGDDLYISIERYRIGLRRCAAVAMIEDVHDPGRGFGTGFLVHAADLDERLGNRMLLLTNAHVVAPPGGDRSALKPQAARIFFKASDVPGDRIYTIRSILWTSLPDSLDASLVELAEPPPAIERYAVRDNRLSARNRVYVAGHPGGNSLMQLSLNDNKVLAQKDFLIHYRAPTEGGSSGSPVFDASWRLVGLHHAGGYRMPRLEGEGYYPANEGIWIQSIREGVSAWLDAGGIPVWRA